MTPAVQCRAEQGFALLMMMLVGVLGATAWLSVSATDAGSARASAVPGRSTLSLSLARDRRVRNALLAYTTGYADHYGPLGAGPGHLPCPDDDRQPDLVASLSSLRRWGPDPPCASRPVATGTLPAHVTIGSVRIALDPYAGLGAAPAYRVDAGVVNNPLGRPVNAATLPVRMADVSRVHARGLSGWMPVRAEAAAQPLQRRVAAWTRQRSSERADALACAARQACSLLDRLVHDGSLQGVPQERHWFVVNGWHQLMIEAALP